MAGAPGMHVPSLASEIYKFFECSFLSFQLLKFHLYIVILTGSQLARNGSVILARFSNTYKCTKI